MIDSMLSQSYRWLNHLLNHPVQVLWICLAVAGAGILLDGTAFRLWSLWRDHKVLTERIESTQARSKQLAFKIQMAQQPEFIERAARDRFDLVKEGDLIFIFSDDGTDATAQPHSL